MNKIALVTGGSSGIGLETAKALLAMGCRVYILSRKAFFYPGIEHIQADVSSAHQVQAAVDAIVSREKKIDILINNAGFGISGGAEFIQTEATEKQMQVNFVGCANVCRAVLPVMRENRGGRIVNLSSMAAVVPIPFQAAYSASKAAINAYTIAIGNEVKPFGISVCAVMPGDIKTNFTQAREKEYTGDDIYGGRIQRSVSKMEADERNGMDAKKAGLYIAKIAVRNHVKQIYALRMDYKIAAMIAKVLPARFLSFVIGKLYAQ